MTKEEMETHINGQVVICDSESPHHGELGVLGRVFHEEYDPGQWSVRGVVTFDPESVEEFEAEQLERVFQIMLTERELRAQIRNSNLLVEVLGDLYERVGDTPALSSSTMKMESILLISGIQP